MVMQRDDPPRLWKLVNHRRKPALLLDGDQSERVGEREMCLGVGVEDGDSDAICRCPAA